MTRIPLIENVRQDGNITAHVKRPDGRALCGARIYLDQAHDGRGAYTAPNCGRCVRLLEQFPAPSAPSFSEGHTQSEDGPRHLLRKTTPSLGAAFLSSEVKRAV